MTRRVAAESSFTLAKGNVNGNGILWTPSQLMVPASRWSFSRYTMRHDTRKNNNATALIYRCPMARHPYSTSQHSVTSGKRATAPPPMLPHPPQLPTDYRTRIIAPQYHSRCRFLFPQAPEIISFCLNTRGNLLQHVIFRNGFQ